MSTQTPDRFEWTELDRRAVDTARLLAADAVQRVGNGHPGTAMSLAPAAYTIFQKVMRHDPADPEWTGRDRFVLSPGHTSLTLYTQLFLAGYELELDDLKAFRTHGSKTPGHPEYGHTAGVETTTGPLGQGVANAVGMAMAARYERGLFDPEAPEGESPFDHTIWAIVSDGDLQEGVSAEASSLAGHQKLGNLVFLYDDNHISIEGDTATAFSEDVLKRYEAYGWHVQRIEPARGRRHRRPRAVRGAQGGAGRDRAPLDHRDAHDHRLARPERANTEASHGSALGEDEVAATKRLLGFDPERTFEVADEVLAHTRRALDRGAEAHAAWDKRIAAWRGATTRSGAQLFDRIVAGRAARGLGGRPAGLRGGQGGRDPCRVRQGAPGARPGRSPSCGAAPPTWPAPTTPPSTRRASFLPKGNPLPEADPYGRTRPLRHPRALDGRGDERHRPARQHPRLRRHLPGVLRLHAQRRADVRADAAAGDVRLDARLHRSRRGRPHPPAGRAPGRRCAPSRA